MSHERIQPLFLLALSSGTVFAASCSDGTDPSIRPVGEPEVRSPGPADSAAGRPGSVRADFVDASDAFDGAPSTYEGDATTAPNDPLVIGGSDVRPGERPWQAELLLNGALQCGGSLLWRSWVLTAAHCVAGSGISASQLSVRLGVVDQTAPDSGVQTRGVLQFVVHPGYNPLTIENDVAVLRLSAPVTFGDRVRPISLRRTSPPPNAQAVISGWGQFTSSSPLADVLRQTVLPVRSSAECNASGALPLPVTPTMLCAGYLQGEKAGCHGDSGGPLVVQNGSVWEQVGTVSWGQPLCTTYTVFGSVAALAPWIVSVTGPLPLLADATGDGCVNTSDLNLVLRNFGRHPPQADPRADLNFDGIVNNTDRLLVSQNFNHGCP